MSDGHDRATWNRIDALFVAALERPPGERSAFLDRACGDDPRLREAVQELLTAEAAADEVGFLSRSAEVTWESLWKDAAPDDGEVGDDPPSNRRGERLGPYRVEEEIGRGGMATVYRARRVDGEFEQAVAVKIVRPSLAADRLVRRMQLERDILSDLSHPNIARILDAGTTDDGLPYLVMEYVEGRPITEFCRDEELDLEERLRLFQEVAAAVDHAHRNLVLHRDLKPSNILVTEEGRVRLLDFGIAKMLDPDRSGSDLTLTMEGSGPFTPDYASPEQVRGERVSTVSDVYQLGVLLYRLLAGRRPYHLEVESLSGLVRALDDLKVRPPSELAVPESSVDPRRLRGDLDRIVLKAMREEPEERYRSAEALADDLRRFLHGLPIAARFPSVGYRLRKFVGRNRWAVPMTAIVFLAFAGYAWTLERHRVELERERVVAQAEAAKATQVRDFLITIFQGSEPDEALGDTVTAFDLLERGAAQVDSTLTGQPDLLAEMLGIIGRVSSSLGYYDRAVPLLERAVTIRRELHEPHAPELAEAVFSLAGAVRSGLGADSAVNFYREAVVHRRLARPVDSVRLAGALASLGDALQEAGKLDSAELVLEEALELARKVEDEESDQVLTILGMTGPLLRAQEKYQEAEAVYRSVLERQRERLPRGDPDLAVTLNNLAYLLRVQGELEEADGVYRESLSIATDIYGPGHPSTGRVRNNLATALILRGDVEGGVRLFRETAEAFSLRWPDGHWRVGNAHETVGKVLVTHGDPAEGLPHLRKALDIYEEVLGPDHLWAAMARAWLGAGRIFAGDASGAEVLASARADVAAEVEVSGVDPTLLSSVRLLADELEERGHLASARLWRDLIAESSP